MKALRKIVKDSPPGYSQGVDYVGPAFNEGRNDFSENCQNYCLPHIPKNSPEVWMMANHMFDPLVNIKSRVNYILPISSPLAGRIPSGRWLMTPSSVRKKLKKLTGLKRLNERKGRHPMYETDTGKRIPIPEHARDLGDGLIRSIIRQAGLDMGLREFQNS